MTAQEFYVLNEHTLVYSKPKMHGLGVLHASILKGSHYTFGTIARPMNDRGMRKATKKDFEEFKISHRGYNIE